MKKVVSVFLALIMLLSLAACGSKQDDKQECQCLQGNFFLMSLLSFLMDLHFRSTHPQLHLRQDFQAASSRELHLLPLLILFPKAPLFLYELVKLHRFPEVPYIPLLAFLCILIILLLSFRLFYNLMVNCMEYLQSFIQSILSCLRMQSRNV